VQRYFIDKFNDDNNAIINGEDVHHITRVMRMGIGDEVICCDTHENIAVCKITEITNETVLITVVKWMESTSEIPIKVTIASGLPKGDKLEYVIQKGTELGAAEFVPFIAARSIVKWDDKKGTKKIERWNKIAKEAAEQSHRTKIPMIKAPQSLKKLIEYSETFQYKIVAYEEEAKRGEQARLANVFDRLNTGESLFVIIGPEGGLTDQEVSLLTENGFIACGFGPRILRTETAPLYVLSAVSYHFELKR
jgi:16S rRNA (uracil1498-N3)-methyltransferase